jgi:hypothetical protein
MDTAAIESLLAQISSAQGGAGAPSTDALSSAILERLNAEVARYAADGGAGAAAASHEQHDASPSRSHAGSAGPRRPAPVDLWRAAHESDKGAKPVRRVGWRRCTSRAHSAHPRACASLSSHPLPSTPLPPRAAPCRRSC